MTQMAALMTLMSSSVSRNVPGSRSMRLIDDSDKGDFVKKFRMGINLKVCDVGRG